MLLFINIFLTNHRFYGYNRGNLPASDRYDIFRYTLASYAAINKWSKCIFYIQLDHDFIHRKEELTEYIHELFGDVPISLYWHRNVYTREWRQAAEEVKAHDDNLMWLTCNDDHPFIDYNLDMINEVTDYLKDEAEPLSTCYYSHWPEIIRVAAREQQERKGNFVTFHWNVHDSIQIVRKEVFMSYWFDYDFGDKSVARTDVIHDYTDPKMMVKCYAPTREIGRHFDGYSHVGNLINVAPPLTIPPGFFEKNIKILYCSPERREGWTHFNPLASDFYAFDKFGTDYKWMIEDVPFFWKDRISDTETGKKVAYDQLCNGRNEAFMNMTKAVNNCFCRNDLPAPPAEWLAPHLRS